MLLLWCCPFKIQKDERAGLQFNSPDYLSLLLTPLRIRWTIPLNSGLEFFPCIYFLPSAGKITPAKWWKRLKILELEKEKLGGGDFSNWIWVLLPAPLPVVVHSTQQPENSHSHNRLCHSTAPVPSGVATKKIKQHRRKCHLSFNILWIADSEGDRGRVVAESYGVHYVPSDNLSSYNLLSYKL